jgi:vacuolar protein sorting-associated protein 54
MDTLTEGRIFLTRKEGGAGAGAGAGAAGGSGDGGTATTTTTTAAAAAAATAASSARRAVRSANVGDASYRVVWSVLLLTDNLIHYLQVSIAFPALTIELISKVVELIRLYDQRARQLVLGAGAIHSAARLKNIRYTPS